MKKILTILSLLALMLSCSRAGESPELKVYKTVHYSVKASGASPKASLDESRYIFESGDRLFVSHYEGGRALRISDTYVGSIGIYGLFRRRPGVRS